MSELGFKVSVIIPVFNAEGFIRRTVNSVINLNDVGEILIIDDGSTDNSSVICTEIANEVEMARFFQHNDKKNHGIAATRNLGIKLSNCEYISFLDADDLYLPNRFKEDKLIFENNSDAEVVYGCCENIFLTEKGENEYKTRHVYRPNNRYTIDKRVSSKELFHTLLFGEHGQIHTSAITIKKSAFTKTGMFNTKLYFTDDTDMWFKLSLKTIMLAGSIAEPISLRSMHDNNITNDKANREKYTVKMYYSFFKWALNQKLSFSCLHNIFMVLKWKSKGYNYNDNVFFWFYFTVNPFIMFNIFFWKKLHLLYFVRNK